MRVGVIGIGCVIMFVFVDLVNFMFFLVLWI